MRKDAPTTVQILSDRIPWFGNHTGYEQLPKYLQQIQEGVTVISTKPGASQRLIGKAFSLSRGWPPRNQSEAAAELRFLWANKRAKSSVCHILYSETHLPLLDRWPEAPKNIIGTLHLPPSQWRPEARENLKRLSSGIVLYRRDLDFFEAHLGQGRVKFVRYGADTEFFRPKPLDESTPKRILFAGCYLRNTCMLNRIIMRLLVAHPELRFDLLVPEHARKMDGLPELEQHPAITWHQKLSDEALRDLYQTCYLLLLPMNESGANTAVVEALACGLPVVTTDIGGIRDYGGGSVYPVVENDEDDAMLALVEQYLTEPSLRNKMARESRLFAEHCLSWPMIAREHLEAYKELTA